MLTFFIALLATAVAGSTGIIFKPGIWYQGLTKPSWTPPNIAFPIIWTILYFLMAIVFSILAARGATGLLALWALQMTLNTLWTPVFFGGHKIQAGLIVIALLWLTLLVLTVGAFTVSWVAGVLLVPYLAWVSVAFSLNYFIWHHNEG